MKAKVLTITIISTHFCNDGFLTSALAIAMKARFRQVNRNVPTIAVELNDEKALESEVEQFFAVRSILSLFLLCRPLKQFWSHVAWLFR